MRVGVHVSIEGGFPQSLDRAKRLACNTMQIFSRSPRGGRPTPLDPAAVDVFHRERQACGIDPLLVHAPYILNLASPDARMWGWFASMYREEYVRCQALGATYLVTHVGSHKGQGEEAGVARVAKALNRTLEAVVGNPAVADTSSAAGTVPPRSAPPLVILLENTAGSGQGLGYSFEQLAAMRAQVKDKARVGICLDTAHLFAAGFPIHTPEGLEETLARCGRVIGWPHVKALHLNDSKAAFNSRVDRHWHIGEGAIGLAAMRRIVTHPRLRELPMILETPKKTPQDDPKNLATVRRLAGDDDTAPRTKGQRHARTR